jgi:Fur family ferric uptake transcriptional regulator
VSSGSLLATESHLGRKADGAIHRRSLLKELKARGIRMTPQRRVVIEIIQEVPRHLDAAELLRLAKEREPEIDRATVYRTISLLKHQGLIDELDLMHIEGEKHYYEVKTSSDHCHLACLRCGAIFEYTSPSFEQLRREIAKQSGFEIAVMRLEVGGVCRKCAGNSDGEAPSHPAVSHSKARTD